MQHGVHPHMRDVSRASYDAGGPKSIRKLINYYNLVLIMNNCNVKLGLKGHVYDNGYSILKNKGLAIVWMSVGNSYFKKEVIDNLIKCVNDKFSKIRILIPNEPAEHTYKALGYDVKTAKKKARLNSNRMKNHTQRAIDSLSKKSDFKIIDWDVDIIPKEEYKKSLIFVKDLYDNNADFRKDARETTEEVLKGKIKETVKMDKAIDAGVKYLIEELAFVIASPNLFKVKNTAYVYHREWPIFEKLVNGVYDSEPKKSLGFLLIK